MHIPINPDRRVVLYSFLAYLLLLFVLYFSAFSGMFKIWTSSETYAHGLIVVPVVFYLLWIKRDVLNQINLVPDSRLSIAVFLLSLGWFMASLLSVNIVEQLAAMLLIPAGVFTFLGRDTFLKLAFPLLYLLFAVPMGEALVPVLQDYTASFTIGVLRLFDFPVFVEGRYFETSSGKYEITSACSGVRYLIASFAVGFLYAYLQFKSWRNRIYIVLLSLFLPVIANGIRAIVIVLLVHYSGGEWGLGADHLYYGWLFFVIVMAVLFAIGRLFHEKSVVRVELFSSAKSPVPGHWVLALSLGGVALISGPIILWGLKHTDINWQARNLSEVTAGSGWVVEASENWDWYPHFENAVVEVKVQLKKNNARVKLESVYSNILSGMGELDVNHRLLDTKFWRIISNQPLTIELNTPINTSATLNGVEIKLASGDKFRLVFYYYNVSGVILRSRWQVKLYELVQVLTGSYRYTAVHWFQVVDLPENVTANEVLADILENFDPANLIVFQSPPKKNEVTGE